MRYCSCGVPRGIPVEKDRGDTPPTTSQCSADTRSTCYNKAGKGEYEYCLLGMDISGHLCKAMIICIRFQYKILKIPCRELDSVNWSYQFEGQVADQQHF